MHLCEGRRGRGGGKGEGWGRRRKEREEAEVRGASGTAGRDNERAADDAGLIISRNT